MQSFLNARFDKAAAVACALTADGALHFKERLNEQAETEISVLQAIGSLISGLSYFVGEAKIANLFLAIPEGSNLAAISSAFNHRLITSETAHIPCDFKDLTELREAALLINARRLHMLMPGMNDAQLRSFSSILFSHAGATSFTIKEFEEHLGFWILNSKKIVEVHRSFPPAMWLAKAFNYAINDRAVGTAVCLSGHFPGVVAPGSPQRMTEQTIALFRDAPV